MRSPSYWLNPRGRATYGIGICARCGAKLYLDQLSPDPNSPGLMVCDADKDVLDPYRLPARQTEQITLPFNRSDLSLTNSQTIPAPTLSGVNTGSGISLSWVEPPFQNYVISSYDLYKKTGTGAFVFLVSIDATEVLHYLDTAVDITINYAYYVIAAAEIRGSPDQFSSSSNIAVFPAPVGPTVPQFIRVDGGVFQPDDTVALLVRGNNTILAGNFIGTLVLGRSVDAGVTWTRIVPTVPVGTATLFINSANATGTVFCALGQISGVNSVLTSTDGGLTWIDKTPVGSSINSAPYYSTKYNSFVVWDTGSVQLKYYTSSDGATWTPHVSVGFTLGPEVIVDGQNSSCAFGLSLPPAGSGGPQVWRTTDGLTWAPVFTPGDVDAIFGDVRSSCSNGLGTFFWLATDSNTDLIRLFRSIDDGITWTEQSSGDGASTPPFSAAIQHYSGFFINATDFDTGLTVARTSDGVTFIPFAFTLPDFGESLEVQQSGDGTTLFAFNRGIASTTNYPAFGTALATPAEVFDMTSGTGYAVVCGDAGGGSSDPAIWRATTP